MRKRIISLILVMTLVVMMSETALAENKIVAESGKKIEQLLTNNSIDSKECRKQINEDMEELEKCGILEAGIIQKIEAKAVVAACGGKELAGWVASSVYTALRNYEPNTKGISYKAKKYYHKKSSSSGYIKSIRQYVYKYNYTWYTKANYKGKTAKATAYRVKEIY